MIEFFCWFCCYLSLYKYFVLTCIY